MTCITIMERNTGKLLGMIAIESNDIDDAPGAVADAMVEAGFEGMQQLTLDGYIVPEAAEPMVRPLIGRFIHTKEMHELGFGFDIQRLSKKRVEA